jgi:hypothetical protein
MVNQMNKRGDAMSTPNERTKVAEPSLAKDGLNLGLYYLWRATNWARPYLGGRRGLIFLAVAVLGVGAVLNWGWLAAIGVAPILLALAPCAVMCALGLCMMKGGGKSCSSGDQSAKGTSETIVTPKPRDEV